MPTSKTSKDAAEETPADTPPTPASQSQAEPAAPDAKADVPEPGVYEYTHSADCTYPHVPLTAHAANPGRDADGDDPGEVPVTATVFDWPFGPPEDGRWTKTRKKPNQAADNEPALSEE